MENNFFGSLLEVIPFPTYAVDIDTYQVIYMNKILENRIYAPNEEFCWKKIYGQEQICSWCSVFKLTQGYKVTKNKKSISTFFDESSDIWLQAYDELITWTDGRIVKCTIAVDITEQKEMQASLIRTHTKLARQTKKLKETNEKYESLAKIDYLTGSNNRRNFFHLGEALYQDDVNCEQDVYIALFDLDNFKQLNDTYGHHLGDKALIAFAKKVEKNINKNIDIFGRLGGEEFALIIKSPNKDKIFSKIDYIRKEIEQISLHEDNKEIHFTVSVGLIRREVGETLDMTLEKADKLLYEAKNSGRNQTKFRI